MSNSNWQQNAACRDADPDMFLAETGDEVRAARRICAACPVREACLASALDEEGLVVAGGRAGVRGGLTPRQRATMAKQQRGPVDPTARKRSGGKPLSPCGTPGAYDRHIRWGEPVDEACRKAHAEKSRLQKAKTRARRANGPIVCGTRRGYQKHRRNGEKACDACRYANSAADRRLRTTGSTVAPPAPTSAARPAVYAPAA